MTWRSEAALAVWSQTALFGCAVIWFGLADISETAPFRQTSLPSAHHALTDPDAANWTATQNGSVRLAPGEG
jgi:hypothetical protein